MGPKRQHGTNRSPFAPVVLLLGLLCCSSAPAHDWPMWRYDASRSAATPEQLPADLQLQWVREESPRKPTWDDPLNLDLMNYDRIFEPIVLGERLIVGFNDRDRVAAFDTRTGKEVWSVFTDGPVRLPPAGWKDNVYFVSDDGSLYCVETADGAVRWKLQGAPGSQKAIGNHRLTSCWPARGGPVVRDGNVYFAASIWPMMGTFLYCLDAETGAVEWVNDSTSFQYIKQPHSAPSFAGVAPQGALVATEDLLVVPGGRSVPAVFDRASGELRYFEINAGGKGTGGTFVAADEEHFFVHTRVKGTRAFALETGVKTAFMPNEPVLSEGLIYSAETEKDQPVIRAYGSDHELIWQVAADGRGDLIRAGEHLYAAVGETITVIRLPQGDEQPQVTASLTGDGQIERLLAANGRLFAVTLEGALLAFGAEGQTEAAPVRRTKQPLEVAADVADRAAQLLAAGDAQGYAFWFGAADESLVEAMAARSPFVQLAVVDEDPVRVDRLRRRLDAAGLYGGVTVHPSAAQEFRAPHYVAHMLFVGAELASADNAAVIAALYESVRPYGGVMYLLADEGRDELAATVEAMELEQARIEVTDKGVLVRRVGALPGSADWTHQYGDVANTIKSDDERVKLPLGILWFGGSSNMDVLPRHGHGPPEQVVGGRLFIQGMNSLSARDVYTGRVLWKREFEDLGTFDVYFDDTYENTPLDPKYNQVHIPGANARGTNYVVTDEHVYIVEGSRCHVLDPASGETIRVMQMPPDISGDSPQWGYIGVYEDVLLAGRGYARYGDRHRLSFESDKQLRSSRAGFGSKSLNRAASMGLVAFDRHTGDVLWQADANHSFWHNGIVAGGGRVYCLDRNPRMIEDALKRRGISRPDTYRIVSFDAHTGERLWEVSENIFGTWLGYSEEHDLLLQAGAAASDRLYDEVGEGMTVYQAGDGSVQWRNDSLSYSGPCILHNEWIITNANSYKESAGAFRITDGEQKMVANPLTGQPQPWKLTRAYGCNSVIASEHLLTFRSGAAGFYDLLSDSGTGNFGGFKSGCTSNLVVANGVLNAPDYTRTCSCAYQNQTSLALVHMPELDYWTIHPTAALASTDEPLRHVGLNFGAPGDRRDSEGLLWVEYPAVGGPSAAMSVTFNDGARFFQHHSSAVSADNRPWVLASGVDNVTDVTIGLTLKEERSLQTGIPVDHPEDDAEEQEDGGVGLTSSDLELVEDGGRQLVGVRFNDIPLGRGSAVRSAFIQFTCDEPADAPTTLQITAEDAGHAERFSSDRHDLSARPRTGVEVDWQPAAWARPGDAEAAQRTPDLAPLIRAVISRPDWKPGNSLAFFFSGSGKRVAASSRGGEDAARLVVDADPLSADDAPSPPQHQYSLRLYFAAPQGPDAGRRRFDVVVQGRKVLEDVVLDPAGSPAEGFAVHSLENVLVEDELRLRLIPHEGAASIAGVELHRIPEP